ncbi:hypothetical protein [Alteriqipengyuania lutimaris]|uniref:Uncharacterized protein n=1 Tax=Alteriqipengyuania lutimaris TaxID=1538146 RepID=A0A395LLH6_9SPHN|nr:hypothetical protein [Alteriqipengyuania lutimaris]MBB3033417.1 drug/metabolite transporter (DMT)-like permease [Alteriqipengyuania lutimaris]RDS77559.1 hypothetical protein DL238_08050 [Alteriqipengyuania lutimaris]
MSPSLKQFSPDPRKKMLVSALFGALAGFFGITLLFRWTDAAEAGDSSLILAGVGFAYLAMGLMVGLGTLMPRAGSKVLNVEDSDELVESRRPLLASSLANVVLGAMMIVLANSGTGEPISVEIAVASVLGALAIAGLLTVKSWKYQDELMRQVSLEGASVAGALVLVTLLVWSAFAMNGIGPAFDAKLVVALVMAMTLVGAFVATGARGMLKPR